MLHFLPLADVFAAFANSSFTGKAIVIAQLAASVYVITYYIAHSVTLNRHKILVSDFRRHFDKTRLVAEYFFTHNRSSSPTSMIYFPATERLLDEIAAKCGKSPKTAADTAGCNLPQSSFNLVKGIAEECLATQKYRSEDGMSLLGGISTLAPFLGLLGTVLGVMEAFQDMGSQGAVNLGTVAPYLSTAMLTTVVGLCVAIPSIIGYNRLARKIGELQIQLDGFADEFLGRIGSEFCDGPRAHRPDANSFPR